MTSDKFMVVGALTGLPLHRGVLRLHRAPKSIKINVEYYIENVFKPLLEVESPKLYGTDVDKVVVHQDQTPSHIVNKTPLI